jgi:hypothetical protein
MPKLWPIKWILHHDNVPAQKMLCPAVSGQKIHYWKENSPYSSDLALNDLLLLPKIKFALKGQRFWDMTALKATPQQEFQKCFQQWQAASLG